MLFLGLQWGDEGKGKVVDVLTPDYQVIARFQGGPNAGHSLHFEGKKYVLHTIPSGIFRDGSINIIGNGVVIDPVILSDEIATLEADGVDVQSKLLIAKKAHLILPTHRIIDAASEASKGKTKIGSTLKGIGPTYMDKTGTQRVARRGYSLSRVRRALPATESETSGIAAAIRFPVRYHRLREGVARRDRKPEAFPFYRGRARNQRVARRGQGDPGRRGSGVDAGYRFRHLSFRDLFQYALRWGLL